MAGYILGGEEKNIVLRCAEVDAVIGGKNGDAALLYLALQRSSGGQDAAALAASLGMTEQTLGRRLAAADDQVLAGLYHDLGFPADVLYQLVVHCTERTRRRYGEGRRPTLRQIEKEGYYWAQKGLFDQESVAAYLRDYDRKVAGTGAYMRVLQLGDRPAVDSEQKYILDWMDKGFPPDTVALAYEITIMRKQKMDWRYLNGILRRWHESGWHTTAQVEAGEQRRDTAAPGRGKAPAGRDKSWMKKYVGRE